MLRATILLAAAVATLAAAPKTAVFERPLSAVTAPAASAPVRNIGQTMHLVCIVFPSESSGVTGLDVRLEASWDNVNYFSIADPVTGVPAVGGVVYRIVVGYGAFPYIRVRSVNATGGAAMTVHYSGSTEPVVSVVQQLSDRFIL